MRYLFMIVFTYLFVSPTNNDIKSNYPIPERTQERLFFIQRNINTNTIVYDANFDKNGNLNEENPIYVYWIRFEENGQKMDLRYLEKTFAFGVEYIKSDKNKKQYTFKIVADKNKEFILEQVAPYKANVYMNIDSKISQLDYMYFDADDTGLWPELKYIDFFGEDTTSFEKTYERVLYYKTFSKENVAYKNK